MPTAHPRVIELLNEVLQAELTAINQYFVHARMCMNWGYDRLHQKIRAESIDEMRHAESLIERILYLEGAPDVQTLGKVDIGETVREMLTVDLALELDAAPRLNRAVKELTDLGDNGSRLLVEEILKAEEQHIDWLEAQLEQIEQMGEQNYLAAQVKGA